MKIKVSIADDHIIVLNGLKTMLLEHPFIELLFVSLNRKELFEDLAKQQPDVLLLDIHIPDIPGDKLARLVSRKYPKVKILALTNMDAPYYIQSMMKNGAIGYLLKSASYEVLIRAIFTVYKGEQFIDETLLQRHQKDTGQSKELGRPNLTRREQEVLELIALEMTNAQIAEKLFVTVSTIENHRTNLFIKLGVKNVVGLVRIGSKLGLIE